MPVYCGLCGNDIELSNNECCKPQQKIHESILKGIEQAKNGQFAENPSDVDKDAAEMEFSKAALKWWERVSYEEKLLRIRQFKPSWKLAKINNVTSRIEMMYKCLCEMINGEI